MYKTHCPKCHQEIELDVMTAIDVARKAGSTKSEKKAAASRLNGLKHIKKNKEVSEK